MPNFDKKTQSTAEIKLFPVSDYGRPPHRNFTSVSSLTSLSSSHCYSASAYKISSKSNHRIRDMTSYPFFNMAAGSHIGFKDRYDNIAVAVLFA